jgi:hypothetical protein
MAKIDGENRWRKSMAKIDGENRWRKSMAKIGARKVVGEN